MLVRQRLQNIVHGGFLGPQLDLVSLPPGCGAKRRDGQPCQKPALRGKRRCRLHGGAPGSGAPKGERNGNFKTGQHTKAAINERRVLADPVAIERIRACHPQTCSRARPVSPQSAGDDGSAEKLARIGD